MVVEVGFGGAGASWRDMDERKGMIELLPADQRCHEGDRCGPVERQLVTGIQ